tara:strand:- start:62 stop:169 length:108 start_codon:yes stop_codon:yes gene_type:complete
MAIDPEVIPLQVKKGAKQVDIFQNGQSIAQQELGL